MHDGAKDIRAEWVEPIASELDSVERKLVSAAASDVLTAFDLSMQLISAGGKRIRPALVVLSALAAGGKADRDRAVDLAAAVELIHMASLVHDDVVDQTYRRRGVPTASAQWGSKVSVLGGDYLLAKAFVIIADDADSEITRVLAAVMVKMTESELRQAASEGSFSLWQQNYHRIIRHKTAGFMGGCCECGAITSGADPAARAALTNYGIHFGLAFQITDDLLDITGDPAQTGKQVGTDISHGKFTLPVLLAVQRLDGGPKGTHLMDLLRKGTLPAEEAAEVARLVVDCGAADLARRTASDYAENARQQLKHLPSSRFTNALAALASFVTYRDS